MTSKGSLYCNVCIAIPWLQLQPEDVRGTPHHTSRNALETSAKTCAICSLVLKAAKSSYRDTRAVRNGRGYLRQFDSVRYHDVDNSERDVMFVKELGACMPVTATEFKGPHPASRAVIAPTGAPNLEGEHVDEATGMERLDLSEPPDDMPVWVYGNYWATHETEKPGDTSALRFVGVGARFAKSDRPFDVFGVPKDQIKLCGSSIGVCTNDGKHSHVSCRVLATC